MFSVSERHSFLCFLVKVAHLKPVILLFGISLVSLSWFCVKVLPIDDCFLEVNFFNFSTVLSYHSGWRLLIGGMLRLRRHRLRILRAKSTNQKTKKSHVRSIKNVAQPSLRAYFPRVVCPNVRLGKDTTCTGWTPGSLKPILTRSICLETCLSLLSHRRQERARWRHSEGYQR